MAAKEAGAEKKEVAMVKRAGAEAAVEAGEWMKMMITVATDTDVAQQYAANQITATMMRIMNQTIVEAQAGNGI